MKNGDKPKNYSPLNIHRTVEKKATIKLYYETFRCRCPNRNLPDFKLPKGLVGTILEVYEPDVFEVEFVDLQGKTYALETLRSNQVMQLHYQPLPQTAGGIKKLG